MSPSVYHGAVSAVIICNGLCACTECVWYVFGYVRKKALLQCLCNY